MPIPPIPARISAAPCKKGQSSGKRNWRNPLAPGPPVSERGDEAAPAIRVRARIQKLLKTETG